MEKAPENLSIPAPSRGAAEGTTVPRDLIAKGQRGFSVETSKLEAIYFQPGFGGDLCQHLRCLAWGAPAPPYPTPSRWLEKGPQGFLYRFSHPTEEDRAVPRAPSPEGKACLSGGCSGWLRPALGSWGADGWENLVISQEGQAHQAQHTWAGMSASGLSCRSFTITIVT